MTGTQLDEVGNTEMLSWAVMFGAIGAQQGELIDYIPTWHHGLGMMRFLPAARAHERADEGRPSSSAASSSRTRASSSTSTRRPRPTG